MLDSCYENYISYCTGFHTPCQLDSWNSHASLVRNPHEPPGDGHQGNELGPGDHSFNGCNTSKRIQTEKSEERESDRCREEVEGEIEHIERDDDDERRVAERFEEIRTCRDLDFLDPPNYEDYEDDRQ